MKNMLVCLALLHSLVSAANAGFVFTSDAAFPPGSPSGNGKGTLTIEQAPLGSGTPLTAPTNLTDGFAVRDVIIRYLAAADDIGSAVFIYWAAERFYVTDDTSMRITARAAFTIELAESKGSSATAFYEAVTTDKYTGLNAIVVDPNGSFSLSSSDPLRSIAGEASRVFSPSNGGQEGLHQNLLIALGATVAGQEFVIRLSPDVGVTSTLESLGGPTAVPAPPTAVLALAAGGLLAWFRPRRLRFIVSRKVQKAESGPR